MKKLSLLIFMTISMVIVTAQNIAEEKIIEMKKIITINPAQEKEIRTICDNNFKINDSILYHIQDAVVASQMKYDALKKLNDGIMNVLSEAQKVKYIQVMSTPEVNAKAEAKIQILRETNEYSESDLNAKKSEIFNYLMLEKVVYARDKFDFLKQKDNIAKLKQIKPNSLKESETREKLKAQGKIQNGNINW